MLEAVTTDLVFTISLKRSTQILQLSTSWLADYPIYWTRLCENFNARRARRSIFEKLRDMRTDNAADIRLNAMLGNCIFYISPMYEFSHSLDPKQTPTQLNYAAHRFSRTDAFTPPKPKPLVIA